MVRRTEATSHVQTSFLLWSISIPRALLLLLTLSIGIAIGALTVFEKRHNILPPTARDEELIKKHYKLQQESHGLENQVSELKSKLHQTNAGLEAKRAASLNSSHLAAVAERALRDSEEKLRTVELDLSKSASIVSHLEKEFLNLRDEINIKEFVDRMVQHDLRGALIASTSLPEKLLDDSNLTESQRVIVALLRDSGKKMLELVDSTMALYRIEEGTYINDPKAVNLFNILNSTASQLVADTDTNIEINCMNASDEDDKSFYVHGDEFLLSRIFMNLISNAMEASPQGKDISITLSTNDYCSIAIRNYGEVPPSIRNSFFNKMVTYGKKYGGCTR